MASDLSTTKRLLISDWKITGISRSVSTVKNPNYQHYVMDVTDNKYSVLLDQISDQTPFDLCIYFAGIGELLNLQDMGAESNIIDVNLTGMVKTAAAVVPKMVQRQTGHFMGISSFAGELLSAEAPSYHASKAGLSNYLGGLALALKPKGIFVTNLRFGFVDTKMAKGDVKPFMMPVEKAVDHIQKCINKKPARYSAPRMIIPLIKFRRIMMKLGAK